MAAAKGTRPPSAGKGRPPGARNKLTIDLKSAIDAALVQLGGESYLVKLGQENPVAFASLLGKRLPKELTGLGGGPLTVQVLQFANHTNPSPLASQALPAPAVELSRTGRQEV